MQRDRRIQAWEKQLKMNQPPQMSYKLTIVQYNCGHSNAAASRALFDSFTSPLVLAIQEPAYNRYTKSTYCPKPYQLAYEALPETRVCFMIR